MKEFIDKLMARMEEEKQRLRKLKNDTITLCDSEVIAIEEGAYNFCKEIINELAEEYKGGWIACKEEMPSKDGNYLVCDAQGNIYIARYYAGSTTFNRNVGYVARAWQPLPAPYTEGE